MVWSCTTCYKCQEHCPQGMPVADILYELRQLGADILRKKEGRA
jgi:heterodisulfide reductase subunit C